MSDAVTFSRTWTNQISPRVNQPAVNWLWQGFIARGNLTLLTSPSKAGKTTLLSMLLSRRPNGGDVGGLPVRPGKTVVVNAEEVAANLGWSALGNTTSAIKFV